MKDISLKHSQIGLIENILNFSNDKSMSQIRENVYGRNDNIKVNYPYLLYRIKKLEECGFVKRKKIGREQVVKITPRGKKLLKYLKKLV